jgi:prepilin-type N-terminal cleavage/methylation domain-containing protein
MPRKRETGFTLIEILIVISIVAILMSMVAGGVLLARKQATKTIAQNQIEQIGAALDRFNEDEGYFPGAEFKDPEDNAFPAVFEALMGEAKPKGKGGRSAPYLDKIKEDDIRVMDVDAPGGHRAANSDERWDPDVKKYIQDPFGQLIWYRLNKGRKRESWMHNPLKFDLWSTGPDKENQTLLGEEPEEGEEKKPDDIGNW